MRLELLQENLFSYTSSISQIIFKSWEVSCQLVIGYHHTPLPDKLSAEDRSKLKHMEFWIPWYNCSGRVTLSTVLWLYHPFGNWQQISVMFIIDLKLLLNWFLDLRGISIFVCWRKSGPALHIKCLVHTPVTCIYRKPFEPILSPTLVYKTQTFPDFSDISSTPISLK